MFPFSIFLLSIGTIFFNNQIKGSCGGITDDCSCSNTEKIKCLIDPNDEPIKDSVKSPVTNLYALMGVLEWSENGDNGYFGKYEGEIENDKPSGKGEINYPDGSKYFGRWYNGKRNI